MEYGVGYSVGKLYFNILKTPCVNIPKGTDRTEPEINLSDARGTPSAPIARIVTPLVF